ncbi:hypothetical protein DL93DRAFT_108519 [Clavulina sp. PMI_390]|nr:hypothetical protein DL93DRAFT_108519 [Clavulina sp. PMI_390]
MAKHTGSFEDLMQHELGPFPLCPHISSPANESFSDTTIPHNRIPRKSVPAPDLVHNMTTALQNLISELDSKGSLPPINFDSLQKFAKNAETFKICDNHQHSTLVENSLHYPFCSVGELLTSLSQALGLKVDVRIDSCHMADERFGFGHIRVLYDGKRYRVACELKHPQVLTRHAAQFLETLPLFQTSTASEKLTGAKAMAAKV